MLASSTATALRRGWPPAVYARLVSQLNDSADIHTNGSASSVFSSIMSDSPPNPSSFEYIAMLSSDAHSSSSFSASIERFAGESPETRPQPSRDLMAYLSRGGMTKWNSSAISDDETSVKNIESSSDQAISGCKESRSFMLAITIQIGQNVPTHLKPKFNTLKATNIVNTGGVGALASALTDSADQDSKEPHQHASSRSTRLSWLDWVLRTAQSFEYASHLKPQLDSMWPGDRIPVITYEVCVTAFDVFAAQSDSQSVVVLAKPFISNRLPLLLKEMAQGNPLDGVISRSLTTSDKSVVEAVEQKSPGLRAEFGMTCVNSGSCDPSVSHVLHRSHTPQPPPSEMPVTRNSLSADYSWSEYPRLDPVSQAHIAQNFAEIVRGSSQQHGAISRHASAQHCVQSYNSPELTDSVFVHISVRDMIESVCVHADAASQVPEEDGGAGLVYYDLGVMLAVLDMWSKRYACESPAQSWCKQFIDRKMFGNVVSSTPEQNQLMGAWIVGSFSGTSSGIADESLKPFAELADVLPVLSQQAVRAYRSAVIDRETFKNGLDYFLQQFSVTLLTPLAIRVFQTDLIEGAHPPASLESMIFFSNISSSKKGPEFMSAKTIIAPNLAAIQRVCGRPGGPKECSPSVEKLVAELNPLINEILSQANTLNDAVQNPSPPPSSLSKLVMATTSSLMNWQSKPQGVPCSASFIISLTAKPALGIDRTSALIRKVTLNKTQSSLETYWALLVVDSLYAGPPLLDESSDASGVDENEKPACDLRDKSLASLRQIATEDSKRPAVVVGGDGDQKNASDSNANQPPQNDTALTEGGNMYAANPILVNNNTNGDVSMNMNDDGLGGFDNMDTSNLGASASPIEASATPGGAVNAANPGGNAPNGMHTGPHAANQAGNENGMVAPDNLTNLMTNSPAAANMNMDSGNQFDYGFDNRQDLDGETDFSKPMDLADLDSAMDFAWD